MHAAIPQTPVHHARPAATPRWQTNFAQLVRSYGVARLARDMDITQFAIYQWVRGLTTPRPANAVIIIVLLRQVGDLTLEDIYQHRTKIQA